MLAAQRPRILQAALREREGKSIAVLYSDADVVWRRDPMPILTPLADSFDVVGAMDDSRICTGFFMFRTG